MTRTPAPFIWYELMTSDAKAAAAFYEKVVGWRIADSGMPGMSYDILHAGDMMVGGLMAVPAGAGFPPMWVAYVHSADVDADTRRAVELGGSVCREAEDIPGVGRFSVIADPGGAMINLFRPSTDELRADVDPATPGHVAWHSLSAGDAAREWAFYEAMFGWTRAEAHEMAPGLVYQTFATGKDPVGGMMVAAPEHPAVLWTLFFAVDGIDAAAKRVADNGGTVRMGPMQVPGGGWIVEAADPQGAGFGLVSAQR